MFKISEKDLHPHILKRMEERGIRIEEIEKTLNEGKTTPKAKEGTFGKIYVFSFFNDYWEGKYYQKKEVTVYYKIENKKIILLTAIARYGDAFI